MRTPRRPDADRRLRRLRAGTQVTLVALPYQVFVLTWSSFAVGLIGLAELVPLVALSFVGGALADRMERRRLLQAAQVVQLSTSALLAVGAAAGPPPVAALYVLAGVAAAASAIDRPTRTAIVPNLVSAQELQPAISLNYGLFQLAMVVGPALGGIVIAAAGLGWAYTLDVVTFAAMLAAVARMRRQQPPRAEGESFLRAVRSGLAYAAGRGELLGSFAVDLLAMTFGMPRALFPALSLTVYHAGATGVRPALRGALVRRHRGGVLDRMAEPHAPAGPDRRRRDRRLGARRDARRPHPQPDRCDGLPRDRRRG